MRCSDVERLLPEIIEGIGHPEFQAHLKACPRCAELVADLEFISSEARCLAECDEPPPRVWVNIANQLRSEGLIREPETASAGPALVLARSRRRTAWWLVPIAAAIVAAGAYQLTHHAAQPVTQQAAQPAAQQPAVQPVQPTVQQPPASQAQLAQSTPSVRSGAPTRAAESVVVTAPHAAPNLPEQAEISPPPSAEDEQFLSEVSQGAPNMRATYEDQLRAVNAEIRETQEYIKWHPGDLDARQHLMEAYQQKAMLYQMALDRIQ